MKKAILVVSFGTTYSDTRKLTLDAIENKIAKYYKDYEVRKAYTSHMVIKKLKNRDNLSVDTPEEALEKLYSEGFEEVVVQPLHIIPGIEYDYVKNTVEKFINRKAFKKLILGTPVMYEHGDYEVFLDAIRTIIPNSKAVIFMAHGSNHYANACYCELMDVIHERKFNNVFIATVEGYPGIEQGIKWLEKLGAHEVMLAPLLVVAGDHVKNDMCGEKEDSWKNILKLKGFKVETYVHGLGELKDFQKIYVSHIKKALENI